MFFEDQISISDERVRKTIAKFHYVIDGPETAVWQLEKKWPDYRISSCCRLVLVLTNVEKRRSTIKNWDKSKCGKFA